MKRFITLFLLTFFVHQIVLAAAAPTVTGSNLVFTDPDGARLTADFTAGNGTNRIIVMKEGSPVTGLPVNGVDYNASGNFGTAGSAFTAPGEYVVGKTGGRSLMVDNLKPGTIYYVAIFEYNGTGTATAYLMLPLTGSQSTAVAPTTQASAFTVTATTGNTITLGFAKGNGTGRFIIARKGAPVNGTPVDANNYYASGAFGSGNKIGTDNYAVYKGTGTSATITNLEPNVTYHFAVFEYNGSVFSVFLTPGAIASGTTNAGPTAPSTGVYFSYIEGNGFRVSTTAGNGTRRIFIAKKGAAVTAAPVNGVNYTANGVFGTAGTEIAPGEFVVGVGTAGHVDMTNLEPNATYNVRVYEYDVDATGYNYYLTSSSAAQNGSTCITPTAICSNLKLNSLSGSSANISFNVGNGSYRTVIMKAGSAVDAAPADLVRYAANPAFGSGSQITPGNYVVAWGINGANFNVSNLQAGTTYYVSIFEFNGSYFPVYSATGATFSFTVPAEPTTAATAPLQFWPEGRSFRFQWTNGNGANRVVIAKKGSAVTAKPVDAATYTADNNFGLGQELAPGEFVVYNGAANNVDMKNMEIGSTYHFAVFDYNVGADGKADYLTSSYLAYNASTATWPTTQTVITSVSNIQAAQATINFTAGNGANRIFIMRKGAPVSVSPQDLTKYNYNATYGAPSTLISDGNHVVIISTGSGSSAVYGLEANTTYYVSGFEFNGSAEPAYLRTAPATTSFTTGDVVGATTPTEAASAPLVSAVDGNQFKLKWTNGNGEKRLVVMRQGSPVTFVPASAISYTANAAFGSGNDLGGGQYAVVNGNTNTVDITNLQPATTYYFTVFEYNGTGSLIRYLTSTVLSSTASTASAPATAATAPTATAGATSLSISWINGSGNARLVVMKEASAVGSAPVTGSVYPSSAVFRSGSQIAAGEYVVYAGNGNTVTVTGLTSNKTYYYTIFEYNGTVAPVYNTSGVSASATAAASLPIQLLYFKAKEENGNVLLTWATAQESNNATFTIEKSTNGGSFAPIKELPGAINSDRKIEYSFTDVKGAEGKTWYRLKQTDLDGRFTYSDLLVVTPAAASGKLSLYPNPVQGQLKIVWPGTAKEAVLVAYNAAGIAVKQEKLVAGRSVNCADWKSGTYYLTVIADGKQYQSVVIKQ